jgi:hypothetical protein
MRTLRYVISLWSQVAPFTALSVYNPKHDVPRHLMSDSAVMQAVKWGLHRRSREFVTTDEEKTQNCFTYYNRTTIAF